MDVHVQNNKIRLISIILHKSNSKWIKDINLKPERLKLLEGDIGYTLHVIDVGKDFPTRTPFDQEVKLTVKGTS